LCTVCVCTMHVCACLCELRGCVHACVCVPVCTVRVCAGVHDARVCGHRAHRAVGAGGRQQDGLRLHNAWRPTRPLTLTDPSTHTHTCARASMGTCATPTMLRRASSPPASSNTTISCGVGGVVGGVVGGGGCLGVRRCCCGCRARGQACGWVRGQMRGQV